MLKSRRKPVVIIGGGPAGVFTACRLVALGLPVTLISRPRPYPAWEGLSERPRESLRHFGFDEAVKKVGAQVNRQVHWNGQSQIQNKEYILPRAAFDRALLKDAARQGVEIIDGRVMRLEKKNKGWRIYFDTKEGKQSLVTDFLVEARGRSAKWGHNLSVKDNVISAPATSALLKSYHIPQRLPPMTSVATFPEGWAWYLRDGKGTAVVQLFISSAQGELPPKSGLNRLFSQYLTQLPEADGWLKNAKAAGEDVSVRGASARKCMPAGGEDFLLVGDSSLGLDPLSGNGIFYAMGSGLAAAPVINTLLNRPAQGPLALQFFTERNDTAFAEGCQMAREFYALERRWPEAPFWKSRRCWRPDEKHLPDTPPVGIYQKPVVREGFVEQEKVIVTPDQPRGVWQVDNVPLVPLADMIKAGADDRHMMDRLKTTTAQLALARQWLLAHKIIS